MTSKEFVDWLSTPWPLTIVGGIATAAIVGILVRFGRRMMQLLRRFRSWICTIRVTTSTAINARITEKVEEATRPASPPDAADEQIEFWIETERDRRSRPWEITPDMGARNTWILENTNAGEAEDVNLESTTGFEFHGFPGWKRIEQDGRYAFTGRILDTPIVRIAGTATIGVTWTDAHGDQKHFSVRLKA